MDTWLQQLLENAKAGNARDLSGTRVALDLSVSDRLINDLLAQKLPPDGAVKAVEVTCRAGDARVAVKLSRPAFLPTVNLAMTVERQPELPASPILVLRLSIPPAIAGLLGAGISLFNVLPRGHRLEGDLLHVDLATVLQDRGFGWVLPYARALKVRFEPGRLVHFVEVEVP
jgi:hypothetical protein